MLPYQHFISCIILSAVLWPWYGINSLLVFLGGFFIDFDHSIWYMVAKKDISILRSYKYFLDANKNNTHQKKYLMIFHTIEFTTLIAIASLYSNTIMLIFAGIILHFLMDDIIHLKNNAFDRRIFSLTYHILKKEKKKKKKK